MDPPPQPAPGAFLAHGHSHGPQQHAGPDFRTLSMPAALHLPPSARQGSLAPGAPLAHAATASAAALQRRGSVGLGGGSPTAAAAAAGAAKHADVYLTELLSYSLGRLRKVRAPAAPWAGAPAARARPRASARSWQSGPGTRGSRSAWIGRPGRKRAAAHRPAMLPRAAPRPARRATPPLASPSPDPAHLCS
jgi:hypothetical protein